MHKRVNCGSAYLTDAALLPATSRLAVASFNRRVRVYETKGWTEAGSYRSFDPRRCVARRGRAGEASPNTPRTWTISSWETTGGFFTR